MQPHLMLGRIAGIEIGLHYSWLIIAALLTLSLAGHFAAVNPNWPGVVVWAASIVTGVLFFAAIVVHEMAHALVARSRGLPVRTITLFALGGVASIERDAADAKTEFWMGIAGPLASVGIGFMCVGLAYASGWGLNLTPDSPPMAVLVWLGYINFMLAAFNMIPGFPLDGGRVLRAAIWWATGQADRATKIAARIGQGVALAFMIFGVWQFLSGSGFGGVWMAMIGWFLLDAAGAAYAQVDLIAGLRGLRVRDILSEHCVALDPRTTLQTFADEYVLRTGQRCFVVREGARIAGLITPGDLRYVERARWSVTPVRDVMRPVGSLRTVGLDTSVTDALHLMGRDDVNQLPVMANGELQGVLSRGRIMQILQAKAELSM